MLPAIESRRGRLPSAREGPMSEFVLQSSLPARYHDALERLVFFNPRQSVAQAGIAPPVEVSGIPALVRGARRLRAWRRPPAQRGCPWPGAVGVGPRG